MDFDEVILCAPVLAELEYGFCKSTRKRENLARLRSLAAKARFQEFDAEAARKFGELKASLRRRGRIKADFDLAIAAIALKLGAILVSDDRAFHDGSIEGIRIENWLAPTL